MHVWWLVLLDHKLGLVLLGHKLGLVRLGHKLGLVLLGHKLGQGCTSHWDWNPTPLAGWKEPTDGVLRYRTTLRAKVVRNHCRSWLSVLFHRCCHPLCKIPLCKLKRLAKNNRLYLGGGSVSGKTAVIIIYLLMPMGVYTCTQCLMVSLPLICCDGCFTVVSILELQ